MNKPIILGLLFFFTFLIYNLNFNVVGSSDNLPARVLPFNILSGKGFYLDEYVKLITGNLYYLYKYQNHYISAYPIMMGVLSIPIYLPFYVYLDFVDLSDNETLFKVSFFLEKISASLMASISVCLMYILLNKISGNRTISLGFSLVFAFATQTFSISSQALWQHGGANLFMIISLILYIKALKMTSNRPVYFYLSLLFGVLAFWTRLNYILYLALILLFISWIDKKRMLIYLETVVLGVLLLVTLNFIFYNSFIGGYAKHSLPVYKSDFLAGFTGLLFSPARGTLFYTPFFFFGFLSILFIKKISSNYFEKYIYLLVFLYFISGATLNFLWGGWWGGWSWGNRLFADIAVSAVILGYFFYKLEERKYIKIIFLISIAYSVFAQTLGVFFYSKTNWESIPNDVYLHKERLWQFNDSPILRSLSMGPDFSRINRIVAKIRK